MDTSFNPDPGTVTRRDVRSIIVQPDGKVLFGGYSRLVSNNAMETVVRLNANESVDSSFNPGAGVSASVFALAAQSDGKVLLGGSFTSINGTLRNRIARLNSDGSLDATFGTGTGGSGHVYAIVVQPDGKVLIGGYFNTVNGTTRTGFARLNADGALALDAGFSPVTIAGGHFDNTTSVNSITLQSDGRMLLGGSFSTVNNTDRNNIARLNADGSLDSSFNAGTGVIGLVY